jgi:hypothetical protein
MAQLNQTMSNNHKLVLSSTHQIQRIIINCKLTLHATEAIPKVPATGRFQYGGEQMTISWDDAVKEGMQLVQRIEQSQMRLGQIADELEPKYGDSTLTRYAQEMKINANTLQNYRSVYRTWHEDPRAKEFPKFSVAKALVRHPDRAKIVAADPNITERQAIEKTKQFKEQQAKYEHYPIETMHKMTLRIVTKLDSFLKDGTPLDDMLNMVVVQNSSDFEYLYKIIRALVRVDERVAGALQHMNIKRDTYEASSPEEGPTEAAPAALEADVNQSQIDQQNE